MFVPSFWKALAVSAAFLFSSLCPAPGVGLADPGFGGVGGKIEGIVDLNLFDPAPSAVTSALGTSGWYGKANAAALLVVLGWRPSIELNQPGTSPGVALIHYDLSLSLGGLLGAEMPDAYVWQSLAGSTFAPNQTYTFSIDANAGSLLDLSVLANSGFGIAITSGATASDPGTFLVDSLSQPQLLGLTLLGGTTERLNISYTTGSTAPTGNIGVSFFAGRGSQLVDVSLLSSFAVDNASLAVPEPSSALLVVIGGLTLPLLRRRRATAMDGLCS